MKTLLSLIAIGLFAGSGFGFETNTDDGCEVVRIAMLFDIDKC